MDKIKETKCEVGEGTKELPLPFDIDKPLTAPGQKARTVKDLQSGSDRLHRGIFK